jgi:hypothetical protein
MKIFHLIHSNTLQSSKLRRNSARKEVSFHCKMDSLSPRGFPFIATQDAALANRQCEIPHESLHPVEQRSQIFDLSINYVFRSPSSILMQFFCLIYTVYDNKLAFTQSTNLSHITQHTAHCVYINFSIVSILLDEEKRESSNTDQCHLLQHALHVNTTSVNMKTPNYLIITLDALSAFFSISTLLHQAPRPPSPAHQGY